MISTSVGLFVLKLGLALFSLGQGTAEGRAFVQIDNYGARGDGVADDAPALLSAMKGGLGIKGGTVRLSCGKDYRFSSMALLPRVVVKGCYDMLPAISETVSAAVQTNYTEYGKVMLDSSGTISCAAQAGLRGVFVQRTGMAIPSADAAAYAGIAITCSGVDGHGSSKSVGFSLSDVMIVGFNTCIDSSSAPNAGNFVVERVGCDAINGALFHNSFDTTRIAYFHKFPYGTETFPHAPVLKRSGYGLKTTGNSDGLTIIDALDLGSDIGFDFESAGNLMIGKIWGDYETSAGLLFRNSNNVQVEQVHIVTTGINGGLGRGIQVFNSSIHILDGFVLGSSDLCMEVSNSNVDVGQLTMQNCGGGEMGNNHSIYMDDNRSHLSGTYHFLKTNSSIPNFPPVYAAAGALTSQFRFAMFDLNAGDVFNAVRGTAATIGWPNGTGIYDGAKPRWPYVASAEHLALPTLSNEFSVTGETAISTISPCSDAGRHISLLLPPGGRVVKSGNVKLAGGSLAFSGPGILRLQCDPSAGVWIQ